MAEPAPADASNSPNAKELSKAESAAMRLIARAEQRSWNLRLKLERRGFDAVCVEAVISRLTKLDLLNDERFAVLWLQRRVAEPHRKASGPRQLYALLRSKNIDHHTAVRALRTVLDDETERALLERFIKQKSALLNNYPTQKQSEAGFRAGLKAEGFSPEVLRRYFEDLD